MHNFYSRFREAAEQWPAATALEMQRRKGLEKVSYAELRAMAEAIGHWLVQSQYPAGTRCCILADNSPRWVAAYLGCIAGGCVAVPLDTSFHADQVRTLLADSGSSLLIVDSKHLEVGRQAAASQHIRFVVLDGNQSSSGVVQLDKILATVTDHFTPVSLPPGSTAAILYTSGTTSDPKGVMLTQENLVGEIEVVFALLRIGPRDAILGVLPLFHALAQMANLLLPLVCGAKVVYLETLNTTELLRALSARDITVFCCVPQFFYLIHERILKEVGQHGLITRLGFRSLLRLCRTARAVRINLGKLLFRRVHQLLGRRMRFLITGGSRFDAQIGRDFYALGFDILQAYGLTETTGGATCTPPGRNAIGSVGPPLPGVEINILDPKPPEDDGGPATGEIAIRGPIVMKGYHNRPDATAAVLQDGWLRTGDLGYVDDGNLFVTGRRKEIIVLSSGKNIYPEEIEAHYLKSPFIKEICVLGLQSGPGEPFSERLYAVVVPNFEVLRQRKIVNAKEVIRFDIETLSAKVPSTKRILSYEIWQNDLPRTTTRKLKRFEIEKRVKANRAADKEGEDRAAATEQKSGPTLSAEDQKWLQQPSVEEALKIVGEAARSGVGRIGPSDNLELDLGLDSIQRIELLMSLQEEFGADLPESTMSEVYTVRELVDAVLGRARAAAPDAGRKTTVAWASVLQSDTADKAVIAATRSRPVLTAASFVLSRVLQLGARDLFDLRLSGIEKLPEKGPYIIAPNHQSYLDPVALIAVLPWPAFRDIFALGTTDIFGTVIPRWVARFLRVVPVDPDASLVPALKAGAYGLRKGKVLLLFPEGERSIDGKPRTFRKGAAILASHLRVPICPVAIDGFFDVWPRGKPFRGRAPLRMAFGDPVMPPPIMGNPEATYDGVTAEVKTRVLEMWEKLREERKSVISGAFTGET